MSKKINRLMTPIFRVSFPHLFTKNSFNNSEPKYMVTAIFPKTPNKGTDEKLMNALKAEVDRLAIDKFGEDEYKRLKKIGKFKMPFRDGEEKNLDGYGPDVVFMTLSTKNKPGVVGRDPSINMEESDVYAGCYARATVTGYAYDRGGGKGVAFGLGNLQKVGEGEPFSSGVPADTDFDEISDDVWDDDF